MRAVAVQPDDKVLIGGNFSFVDGEKRPGIARLNNATFSTTTVTLTATDATGASRSVVVTLRAVR